MSALGEPRVLAITREEGLLRLLRLELDCAGVELTSARSISAAAERLEESRYDALLIDANILSQRHGNGSSPARQELPGAETIPTVMLAGDGWEASSAWAGSVDEFVALPVDATDVASRVLSLVSRPAANPRIPDMITYGETVIDFRRRQASRGGRPVRLNTSDWDLLRALACTSDSPIDTPDLLEMAWGASYRDDSAMLIAWIRQLRRRLEADPGKPEIVLGNIVDGYSLVAPEDETRVESETVSTAN